MKKIKSLKSLMELWLKVKWILAHSKPIIPFLMFLIISNTLFSLISLYSVHVSKSLIDSAIEGNSHTVIKWLILMIAISLFSMLSSPITSFISTHASTTLNQNIQKKIYKHIEYCDWLELSKHHSVSLLTRITSDVSNISSSLLVTIPSIVSLSVTLIGSFYILVNWAPLIAIFAIALGPFLVIIGRFFTNKIKSLYKESQEIDIKYRAFMQESMQNIMIIKTFCMEKINMDKLKSIQKDKYKLAMKNTKFSVMTSLSVSFCSTLAYFSIFSWGILNISKGFTTYGTFTGLLQLYGKVQAPFSSLASIIPGFISTIAAAERLMEIEAIPLEKAHNSNEKIDFITPNIQFNNIAFSYRNDINILKNINFNIGFGETIALIGKSGEGKTTIIRLLLSLINPCNGIISFADREKTLPLNRFSRNLISYVPQGNTLFSGTIEENLRYGNPHASIDDIRGALKAACALDFVDKLDFGIKTIIGERGLGISEGQAQRLAIARCFLRKKPILILDEATSSLDAETEINVLKSITLLPHKPTCIIITHRPSALDICNRILKIEKGGIKEIKIKIKT